MANNEQIYLKINGVAMPTPTKYEYTEADFDSPDSHRSETGVMIRDPIRFDCHTVKCTWNAIKTTDLRKLKNAFKAKSQVQVAVCSPFAASSDHLIEYTAYVQATRTYGVVLPSEGFENMLWSFECSFIEY